MAVRTWAALIQRAQALFTTNGRGDISGADLRTWVTDLLETIVANTPGSLATILAKVRGLFTPKSTDVWAAVAGDHEGWDDADGLVGFYSGSPSAATLVNPGSQTQGSDVSGVVRLRIQKRLFPTADFIGGNPDHAWPAPAVGDEIVIHADDPYIAEKSAAFSVTAVASGGAGDAAWWDLTGTMAQTGGDFYSGGSNFVRLTDETPGAVTVPANQVSVTDSFLARLRRLSSFAGAHAASLTTFLMTASAGRVSLLAALRAALPVGMLSFTGAPPALAAVADGRMKKYGFDDARRHILGPKGHVSLGTFGWSQSVPGAAGKISIQPESSGERQVNLTWADTDGENDLTQYLVIGQRLRFAGGASGEITVGGVTKNSVPNGGFQFNLRDLAGNFPSAGNVEVFAEGQAKTARASVLSSIGNVGSAYTGDGDPTLFDLETGVIVCWKPNVTNTGAPTLAVDGLAAKSVKHRDGSAVAAGELPAGVLLTVVYDGADWILSVPPVFAGRWVLAATIENIGGSTQDLLAGLIADDELRIDIQELAGDKNSTSTFLRFGNIDTDITGMPLGAASGNERMIVLRDGAKLRGRKGAGVQGSNRMRIWKEAA